MKDIAKTALVLCLIAIVAGLLLGGVNQFTYMSEDERVQRNLAKVYELNDGESFATVENLADYSPAEATGLASVEAVYFISGQNLYIYQTDSKGFSSGLKLMICVKDDKVIKIVKVAGGETIAKPFNEANYSKYYNIDLTTIDGFITTDTKYNKDNSEGKEEIDAVTGATLSSNAIAYSLDSVVGYHKNLIAADYHNTHPVTGGEA